MGNLAMAKNTGAKTRKKKMGPVARAAADRIRQWLHESGMTQQALADHAGVKQSSINSFLLGKNATSIDNLAAIAEAFGRDLCDVFEETAPAPTKYAELITAWNSIPLDQWRDDLMGLMKNYARHRESLLGDRPPSLRSPRVSKSLPGKK
jgi:transcriptional regulator with XRE-family HTH domain